MRTVAPFPYDANDLQNRQSAFGFNYSAPFNVRVIRRRGEATSSTVCRNAVTIGGTPSRRHTRLVSRIGGDLCSRTNCTPAYGILDEDNGTSDIPIPLPTS